MSNVRLKSRITVVSNIYHSVTNNNTVGPEAIRYSRHIDSDEKAYARTITLTPEWSPLDLGWLKGNPCSLIVLENSTKRLTGLTPTDEERAELAGKIVEYGMLCESGEALGIGSLSPEEGTAFSPLAVEKIAVRSLTGAKLSYFVVPK